jgi:hypothetical protein
LCRDALAQRALAGDKEAAIELQHCDRRFWVRD